MCMQCPLALWLVGLPSQSVSIVRQKPKMPRGAVIQFLVIQISETQISISQYSEIQNSVIQIINVMGSEI